jgi:hypothetical protein
MTEKSTTFCISNWYAWAPGVQDFSAWGGWISGKRIENVDLQPDVSFLPALLRRRLDRVGRMALHVAWHCAEGHSELPLVFASRHGSLARTVDLLGSLDRYEPLSPTAFSLSVHNSTAGLFSIARTDRSPATALAAGPDTLAAALLEGVGLLVESKCPVLVVFADETPPPEYQEYMQADQPVFALGLLLIVADGKQAQCELVQVSGSIPEPRPEAMLMKFLLENAPSVRLDSRDPGWQLQRVDGHV